MKEQALSASATACGSPAYELRRQYGWDGHDREPRPHLVVGGSCEAAAVPFSVAPLSHDEHDSCMSTTTRQGEEQMESSLCSSAGSG
jgi:hypothetical protein